MPAMNAADYMNKHRNNIMAVSTLVMDDSHPLEVNVIRRHIPEDAARENISVHQAETIMLEAIDHLSLINSHLGRVNAAKSYFKRLLDLREKRLLGDPSKRVEGDRTIANKEFRMTQDENWQSLFGSLTLAEELAAYLERQAGSALEILQVSKKLYDSAVKSNT